MAYPRVIFESFPFLVGLQPDFDECWKELAPPGIEDCTADFLQIFSSVFHTDWMPYLRKYYRISIGAIGTITRLHVESANAHMWLNQIEGRRVFFLFPPEDADKLYSMPMKAKDPKNLSVRVSPVDVYYPSTKRHPRFTEAKAHVLTLYLGQTLVIPSGWWWYSVAVETSVTLSHRFWNADNKKHFVEELWSHFELGKMRRDEVDNLRNSLEHVHREIMGDLDSDLDG